MIDMQASPKFNMQMQYGVLNNENFWGTTEPLWGGGGGGGGGGGAGDPAGLYADKSVKWLQLVIEVREVVITRNTTSTYALLSYLYINCTSQEIATV